MGRHVIGYEVQKVLAAVDWFRQQAGDKARVGVAGYAEGGLLAFYAAALDRAIDAVLVSGYFDARERSGPNRSIANVWSLIRRFGDAEIGVARPASPPGRGTQSRPDHRRPQGRWKTPEAKSVRAEFARIRSSPGSASGFDLGRAETAGWSGHAPRRCGRSSADWASIRGRTMPDRRRPTHAAALIRRSGSRQTGPTTRKPCAVAAPRLGARPRPVLPVRGDAGAGGPAGSTQKSASGATGGAVCGCRPRVSRAVLHRGDGRFDEPLLPPQPRTRKIKETDR